MNTSWSIQAAIRATRIFFATRGILLAQGLRNSSTSHTMTTETTQGTVEAERWDQMLDHLSSMISQKRRADGATWKDAHENMPVYLQVCAA